MKHRKKHLKPKGATDQSAGNENELKNLASVGQTDSALKDLGVKARPRSRTIWKWQALQSLSEWWI